MYSMVTTVQALSSLLVTSPQPPSTACWMAAASNWLAEIRFLEPSSSTVLVVSASLLAHAL